MLIYQNNCGRVGRPLARDAIICTNHPLKKGNADIAHELPRSDADLTDVKQHLIHKKLSV